MARAHVPLSMLSHATFGMRATCWTPLVYGYGFLFYFSMNICVLLQILMVWLKKTVFSPEIVL